MGCWRAPERLCWPSLSTRACCGNLSELLKSRMLIKDYNGRVKKSVFQGRSLVVLKSFNTEGTKIGC